MSIQSPSSLDVDDRNSQIIEECTNYEGLMKYIKVSADMKNSNPELCLGFNSLVMRTSSILLEQSSKIYENFNPDSVFGLLEFIQTLNSYEYPIGESKQMLIESIIDQIEFNLDNRKNIQLYYQILENVKDIIRETDQLLMRSVNSLIERMNTIERYIPSSSIIINPSQAINNFDPNKLSKTGREISKKPTGPLTTIITLRKYDGGKEIAVKTYRILEYNPVQNNLIENEIKCLETLGNESNPNIVKYYGKWKTSNEINIAMDYYEKTFEQLMREEPNYVKNNFDTLSKDLIRAFAAMQNHNIHHGDIKPNNIMVDDQKKLRIIDFGYSVISQESSAIISIDNSIKTVYGTPGYLAPEIHQVKENIDNLSTFRRGKADVFSLGIVFIQMLGINYRFNYPVINKNDESMTNEKINQMINQQHEKLLEEIIPANEIGRRKLILSMVEADPKLRKTFKGLNAELTPASTEEII